MKCEFRPVSYVPNKYLKHTLCIPTESCRAWSTAQRCSSGIEYKNQDVTAGCTWPCRVRTFEAFSTASDKHQVLQTSDVFSYNARVFKQTWRDLVWLFKEVDSDQRFVKNKLSRKKSCLICRQLLQSFYHTKMGSPITGVYPIFENGVPMRGLSDFLTRYRGFIEDDYRR